MTLAKFARLCESIEFVTPTTKVKLISKAMSGFSDKALLIKIFSLEHPVNNIGGKRAVSWLANSLGMFEDEVEDSIYTWGDIGEALAEIDEGNEEDSNITLKQFSSLLDLNCSRINSEAYVIFAESIQQMSAREKKWFARYWLHKPRNGINNKIPLKVMKEYYKNDNIEKYYQYNKASDICAELEAGNEPECKLVHGQFVNPMLAKARKGKEKPDNYIMDIKYDGNRYQIHKQGKAVLIFNRKGKMVTDQYPDVVEIVKQFNQWSSDLILDTEIFPVNPDGSPAPHKLLGKRVHKKDKAAAVIECPVRLAVFDLLSCGDTPLLDSTLEHRLEALEYYIPEEYQAKKLSDLPIEAAYNIAIDLGFEGIMIKDADMAYQPGKRSKGWLKYKPPRISLDVVITSAKYGKGKRNNVFGTFGISVKDGSDYVSVGRVGTGFSDWDLNFLTTELRKNVDHYTEDEFFFLPRIVLEVTSDLVTNDADGNIGLRFPRNVRIRHDKYAADIDTLARLMEMV